MESCSPSLRLPLARVQLYRLSTIYRPSIEMTNGACTLFTVYYYSSTMYTLALYYSTCCNRALGAVVSLKGSYGNSVGWD